MTGGQRRAQPRQGRTDRRASRRGCGRGRGGLGRLLESGFFHRRGNVCGLRCGGRWFGSGCFGSRRLGCRRPASRALGGACRRLRCLGRGLRLEKVTGNRLPPGARRAGRDKALLQQDRDVLVHGTGVSLLFGHAKFGQQVENRSRLDFQFACQLIDSNLLHIVDAALQAGLAPNAPCSAPPLPVSGLIFSRKTRGLHRIRFI